MNTFLSKFSLFVMLLSCMMFIACGDDDDDVVETSIVGAWKSETLPFYETEEDEQNSNASGTVNTYFWYKEDGQFVEVDVISDKEHAYYEISEHGKWSVAGDRVTQTTNFEEEWEAQHSIASQYDTQIIQFSIDGNDMLMTYQDENGKSMSCHFKKISQSEMEGVVSSAKKSASYLY